MMQIYYMPVFLKDINIRQNFDLSNLAQWLWANKIA